MKKYKKLAALLLAGILAGTIVGCGGNSGGGTETQKAADAAAGAEGAISGDLKMIFWDSNQESGLTAMADGFMAQNPGITVTVETVPWDEYWMKLQAAAQGGGMPDVVVMHPDEVENYASGGMLTDLSDILNGEVANASHFPDYVVNDFKVGEGYYGMPKDIGTLGLFYNKDIFDAAGEEYPTSDWTWEDLFAAAGRLTDAEKGIYGIAADNNGQNFYWNLIWQNNGEIWDEENDKCLIDTPEAVEALEYAVSFVEQGYSPTPADLANLTADEYFESGKTAMSFAGSWMLTEYQNVEELNFGVTELPAGKKKAVICSGMAFSVSAATENPAAALKLVEYMGSEEGQTIQAESGVAIPAYKGTQQPWVDQFKDFDASAFVKGGDYGHTSPGLGTTNEATSVLDEFMPQMFSLTLPVEEGCKTIAEEINSNLE